jgi:hypothetical protein
MLRHVSILRIDIPEEIIATIIRMTRIGKLGNLAVTSKRRTLRSKTM